MAPRSAVLDGSRPDLRLPRPGMAALPLLALALVSAMLDAAPGLPWAVGMSVAGIFLVAALVRWFQAYLELRRLRATADRLLLRHEPRRQTTPLLDWRSDELTGADHRRSLARSLRRLVRELDPAVLPGASPLNRRAVRPYAGRLGELAAVLDDSESSVSARGVLLLETLLCDPASPIYDGADSGRLAQELDRAARALVPDAQWRTP